MKILVLVFVVSITLAFGGNTDLLYGERAEIRSLATAMRFYIGYNNGKLPHSWQEFGKELNIVSMSDSYAKSRGQRYEDKYIFINDELDIPRLGKRTIVLMRINPINFDNRSSDERLFVYVEDGKVGSYSVPETEAEKMFADVGKEIPGKGSKPDRESMVNGKAQYVAADATPTPIADQPLQIKSTPFQNGRASTPAASPGVQPTPTIAEKPSSGILVLAIVALAGLLAGALVLFMWRK